MPFFYFREGFDGSKVCCRFGKRKRKEVDSTRKKIQQTRPKPAPFEEDSGKA